MKKIFFILATILTFTACSSDDDNGGVGGGNGGTNTSGGNSWTNPAKRTSIPTDQLTGKWVFDKNYYTIECDDANTYKKIEQELKVTGDESIYPRVGMFKFRPGEPVLGISGMKPEGRITWNYEDSSNTLELFGDYFSNQDTIFYYHWSLKKKYHYMLKKGDRLTYNFEDTYHFQIKFKDGGVKNVVYYAEYARMKD